MLCLKLDESSVMRDVESFELSLFKFVRTKRHGLWPWILGPTLLSRALQLFLEHFSFCPESFNLAHVFLKSSAEPCHKQVHEYAKNVPTAVYSYNVRLISLINGSCLEDDEMRTISKV